MPARFQLQSRAAGGMSRGYRALPKGHAFRGSFVTDKEGKKEALTKRSGWLQFITSFSHPTFAILLSMLFGMVRVLEGASVHTFQILSPKGLACFG